MLAPPPFSALFPRLALTFFGASLFALGMTASVALSPIGYDERATLATLACLLLACAGLLFRVERRTALLALKARAAREQCGKAFGKLHDAHSERNPTAARFLTRAAVEHLGSAVSLLK